MTSQSECAPRWQRIEEELFPGKTRYMLLAEIRSVLMSNPELSLDELDKVFRKCGDYEHELVERGILAAIAGCEENSKKAELLFIISCSLRGNRLEGWVPSLSYARGVVWGVLSATAKVSLEGEGGILKPLAAISCQQDWTNEQRERISGVAGSLYTDDRRPLKQKISAIFPKDRQALQILDHFRNAALTNSLSPIGTAIAHVIFDEFVTHLPLHQKIQSLVLD